MTPLRILILLLPYPMALKRSIVYLRCSRLQTVDQSLAEIVARPAIRRT